METIWTILRTIYYDATSIWITGDGAVSICLDLSVLQYQRSQLHCWISTLYNQSEAAALPGCTSLHANYWSAGLLPSSTSDMWTVQRAARAGHKVLFPARPTWCLPRLTQITKRDKVGFLFLFLGILWIVFHPKGVAVGGALALTYCSGPDLTTPLGLRSFPALSSAPSQNSLQTL